MIFPGAIGVLCGILFLFSIQVLPFNLLGLLLVFLGIVCFVLEMQYTSYGLLTLGGLTCFAFGAALLFDVPEEMFDPRSGASFAVPLTLILPSTIAVGAFVMAVMYVVVRAQRRVVLTAAEGMPGETGTLKAALEPGREGQLFIRGEYWRIVSDEPLPGGAKVVVESCDGLLLKVKKREVGPEPGPEPEKD
jgi:membrane-bound serine protease (ClpP class)